MLSMPIHVVITCHIADLLSSLALDDNFELQCMYVLKKFNTFVLVRHIV